MSKKNERTCLNCKYWNQITLYEYEGVVNDGKCKKLMSELDINLKTGRDGGYIESIETRSTFGCVLFEAKQSPIILKPSA